MQKRLMVLIACVAVSLAASPWCCTRATANRPGQSGRGCTPKTATSKITHVTVYPNSALVTREVEVPAGAGTIELVVTPLPEHTVNSSLYSEGADGIRVLTMRFRTRPVKEDTREEVRKLEDEAKKLRPERPEASGRHEGVSGKHGPAHQARRLHHRQHQQRHREGQARQRRDHRPGQVPHGRPRREDEGTGRPATAARRQQGEGRVRRAQAAAK